MSDAPPRLPRTLWLGLLLVLALLGLAYVLSLPGLRRVRLQPAPPVLGTVAAFKLMNQDGGLATLADLSNHVWVADIIFTRCAGPCPIMSQSMRSLQDALPATSTAKLVTLTTDPDFDTPMVLKKYAERYGADSNRWMFLTGPKVDLARLAANSLKLSAVPVKPEDQQNPADLFVHSTMFVVVDKHGRLRGVFESQGEDVDWTKVRPRLLATVEQLEHEQ